MRIAPHPPHGSERTDFPYSALAAGQPPKRAPGYGCTLTVPAPAQWASSPGSVSSACRAWAGSPWLDPFPLPPPPRGCPLCSAASPVLWIDPTSHDRSSSVFVLRLSDTVCTFADDRGISQSPCCVFPYMPGVSDLAGPPSS